VISPTGANELNGGHRKKASPVFTAPRIKNLWWTPGPTSAQKTHCPRGHPYDEANTYRRKQSTNWIGATGQVLLQRECKRCLNAKWMRYYRSHRYKFRLYRKAARRRVREAKKAERMRLREARKVARMRGELWAYLK